MYGLLNQIGAMLLYNGVFPAISKAMKQTGVSEPGRVLLGHYHEQGIDFAVFDAGAGLRTDKQRTELLTELVMRAIVVNLKVDKAALVYEVDGQLIFWGTPDLAQYLSSLGRVPAWTHWVADPITCPR